MADPISTATVPFMRTSGVIAEHEARFVLAFVEASKRKMQPYFELWDEVFANYMVTSPWDAMGRTQGGIIAPAFASARQGSYLKDPETHQVIESLVAQALLLLLGQREYISATPVGPDDPDKARLVGRLLQAQMEQPGVFRTHYQLFKNAFLFGTSILEIGWETKSRLQLTRQPQTDPETGEQRMVAVPTEVTYRDRPLQREIPLWDFYPDPSGVRIHEDMMGVAKRFEIGVHDAIGLAEAGVYSKDGVKRAINQKRRESLDKSDPQGLRAHSLPDDLMILEGVEYWGYSPIAHPDGATNRVITLLEGENVRSHINPFLDGGIPFKEIVANPVTGRFYGLGPAEVIRYLQDSADNMLMVLNDASDLAVRSPLLVGLGFGGDPQQLKARQLNDLIYCRDPKAVQPVPTDLSVIALAAQELDRRKGQMREASGATNPMQAIPSGDRATATEVSELVRLASQRVESMANLIEREDYPWIGRTLHSRNQQFLPPGGAVATLLGESFEIPLEAINTDLDVRFIGSKIAQSRFQKTAALKEGIVTLASSLELLPIMPELIERYLRDGLEIPDASEIMKQVMIRTLAMNMGGGAGMTATAGPNAPTQAVSGGGSDSSFGTEAGQTERDGQRVA